MRKIEAGNVHLPGRALEPWIDEFIEECASFPKGAFDDQVDAMSQALMRLANRRSQIFAIDNEELFSLAYWRSMGLGIRPEPNQAGCAIRLRIRTGL